MNLMFSSDYFELFSEIINPFLLTIKLKTIMYIVTIYDHNSTKENPIEPKTIVVSNDKLSEFVVETLDENHSILVAPIKSF